MKVGGALAVSDSGGMSNKERRRAAVSVASSVTAQDSLNGRGRRLDRQGQRCASARDPGVPGLYERGERVRRAR
jgi:hypothetical protein